MQKEGPKVGVGVIVCKGGKVLMGERAGARGEDSWAFAGGHLERGETIFDCARREVREETGIAIKNLTLTTFTEDFFSDDSHYITLFVAADYDSGEVAVMEKDKCREWQWFEWNNLPQSLFLPVGNLIKQGYSPFE